MIKIGILFGGASFENEISIITAFQLKKKLIDDYNIHLIYVDLNNKYYNADKMKLNDFKRNNYKKLKKLSINKMKLDIIVGAMHGENGEDGLACSFARINNIKYLGCNLFASSLSLDKYKSYLFLNNNIKMIDTIYYTYEDYLSNKVIDNFPIIIKPINGGSSLGINVARNKEELDFKLNDSFKYSKNLIIQPYYENVIEYNLALNEKSYSNLEMIDKSDEIFSFENKYSDSFKLMHKNIIEDTKYHEFCSIARDVYNLISASGIIRIDFFLIDNIIYVNEINTTPGALAMYLFNDFNKIFKESLDIVLSKKNQRYKINNLLLKSDINK